MTEPKKTKDNKTPTQLLRDEVKTLKKENKRLNAELLKLAKNSGPIVYTSASVGIDYQIDNVRNIKLGLDGNVANTTPTEAHRKLFVELRTSLANLIEGLIVPEKGLEEEK